MWGAIGSMLGWWINEWVCESHTQMKMNIYMCTHPHNSKKRTLSCGKLSSTSSARMKGEAVAAGDEDKEEGEGEEACT